MDLANEIEFVLGLKTTPSERLGVIALLISDDGDLTTNELNHITNCLKTFNDYVKLFEESIGMGLVYTAQKKSSSGYIRQHFCINKEVLTTLIETED